MQNPAGALHYISVDAHPVSSLSYASKSTVTVDVADWQNVIPDSIPSNNRIQ
jgi:hypothetical protein